MTDVLVAIFHPEPAADAGLLVREMAAARRDLADRHARGFLAAGATRVRIVSGPPDDRPFGARLRELLAEVADGGLVILGSGAISLAVAADRRELVDVARGDRLQALTNNRYSADVVAIARAGLALDRLPDLASDNALPRWLQEVAGVAVRDLRRRNRLGIDIDGPLDLVLLGGRWATRLEHAATARVKAALARVRTVATDPHAELVVAGRVSGANPAWLETHTASRTRVLIEERGLRTGRPGQRPPASVLGTLLDRDGPGSIGATLATLGEAALIDTRILLAHRLGADERGWPPAEDRFASDLLLHERVADPWLRDLTWAAADAPIPMLLGGHTLVGPGLRLALGRGARPAQPTIDHVKTNRR